MKGTPKQLGLNLFVAFDLNYHKTKITDYTNINPELVEQHPDFIKISDELEKYHKNVKRHYRKFLETQRIWAKIME